jgi:single-stranded-DNA-specific exonuclease
VTFTDLHPELLTHLDALQPTGYGNSEAFLLARRLKVVRYHSVGKENQHLKLLVTDGWYSFDAIAFRQGHWVDQIPPYIDMIFTYELNEYNGRQNLQLNVRDLRPSGSSD